MGKKLRKLLKSFTLIELLIVIGILAVFGVMAILTLTYWWGRARDSRQITDITALRKSLTMYYTQNSVYPKPSSAITINDQKGNLLGLQGYFDEEIFKTLANIPRIVKDPSTNNYYTYTRYLNNQGFELGTFLNEPDKYTKIIGDKAMGALGGEPYVSTYGIIGYCDNEGKVVFPKPLSLFDFNKKQFVTEKNLGPSGKIYLNLNYLRGNGSMDGCSSQITAPIIGVDGSLTGLEIKQAAGDEVKVNNDSLKDVLEEVCTHHGLCNAPDIYRISYNYIVLVYRGANGEIIIVEVMLDATEGKYTPMGTPKQIYEGGGTSPQSGQVYGLVRGKGNSYEIYYGGGGGGLMRYSGGWGGGGGSSSVGSYAGGGGSITGPLNFASSQKVNGNQSVGTYSVLDPVTNKSKGYIISYKQDVGGTSEKNVEIPFECRMPKIIYLQQDVYIISYIGEDGKFYIKKVRIGSNGSVSGYEDVNTGLDEDQEYNEAEYLQVWDNMFLMKYVDNEGKTRMLSMGMSAGNATIVDEMILETSPTNNLKMENIGGGYVNVSYMKGTMGINKLVYVSQEGQISLKETKSYNCEEMIMSTVDMGQTVGVCSGLTPTFDLMSQSSLLSQGINYGEEQMCGGTLPEFAELNGIEKTGKEWQYNTESGECNFKCMDSYYYSDGICKSYNCSVTSTQVNNHNYYVDAMLNGQILPVLSEYMPIENGKSQYKQSFQCNTNNLTPTGGETIIDTVCNNGFIKVGNNCINQPTSKSCSETLSQNPDSMNGMYWIDPDLEGGNLPVEVYCDMGNGGWTRVQYENFETGSTSGWTNNRLTRCSSYGYILGGYGVLGRVNNSKTYNLKGVPHTQVKATMNYMFIDSWDGERGDVYLGGTRIFSMNMDTHTNRMKNFCGWSSERDTSRGVSGIISHTGDSVEVRGYSTLNESTGNESWGLDNVAVWVK